MAIITTGNNFDATDAVTSTKLNNIANAATFVAGAVDGTSLELKIDGKLGVKDAGITLSKVNANAIGTSQLVNNAVTTGKILNGAVTTDKILNEAVTTVKIDDSAVTTAKIKDAGVTAAKLATDALELVRNLAYPVGSVYMNATVATNPATLLGFGTWVAFSTGRILIGAGQGTDAQPTPETVTFTASSTGGEYNHTLTEDEIPVHSHVQQKFTRGYNVDYGSGWGIRPIADVGGSGTSYRTNNSGGGLVHNNLQPYLVVYMWTRTA
tara:strand:- start:1126 stop:1926 length:801 start_codon:yes stop_codon:yes gene_type:complete